MIRKNLKSKIIDVQKMVAAKLSSYDSKLSAKKKTVILVLICFLFGIISMYVMLSTLTKRFSSGDVPIMPIAIPYHIGKNFRQPGGVIDCDTYNRVEHFKHYLDSLKINNIGRYTEILNTRPHLMDSIVAFEKVYITQLKK